MKSRFRSFLIVLACLATGLAGCSRRDVPAPAVVEQATEPAAGQPNPESPGKEPGTVKIEFDVVLDPRAIVSISGSEFTPKDLEQPITLEPGTHTLTVRQAGLELPAHEFTVESSRRTIVRIGEPNRRAAEWVLRLGGFLQIAADGSEREVRNVADLPTGAFRVRAIGLVQKPVTDSDLEYLQGLTQLRHINLDGTPITGSGFAPVRSLPELDDLILNSTKVSDASLSDLQALDLPKLSALHLARTAITDAGVAHLKERDLTVLSLAGTQLTDARLARVSGMRNLHLLHLRDTQVTDAGMEHLQGLTNLKELELDGLPITDEGAARLTALTELRRLTLHRTSMSDAGLMHLKALKQLQHLGLSGTQVTDTAIADFKAALPECNIQK